MNIQAPFTLASVYPLGVWRSLGLRLRRLCQFQAFLASSPCAASASSYRFCSAVPPRWCCAFSQFAPVAKFRLSVLASGPNISVKPTRILRSAYLARYAPQNPRKHASTHSRCPSRCAACSASACGLWRMSARQTLVGLGTRTISPWSACIRRNGRPS